MSGKEYTNVGAREYTDFPDDVKKGVRGLVHQALSTSIYR